jgi:hypothetical protein
LSACGEWHLRDGEDQQGKQEMARGIKSDTGNPMHGLPYFRLPRAACDHRSSIPSK